MAKKKQQGGVAANGDRVIATNRRARFDYELLDKVEAGLVLTGSEARALRDGTADITEAWVDVQRGEAWVKGMRIPTLTHAFMGHAEKRDRKLLLHGAEIEELSSVLSAERMTLVVTKIYFKDGRAKLEVASARGKQQHDKRQAVRERDADMEARSAMRKSRH
jgi:SsrA-binding protein